MYGLVRCGLMSRSLYWNEVQGATGYRVRWGTASGVYPNASSVLPADARRLTVEGLVSDQEYYFVVEAEYNGVWSAPSEEDSAVPHAGAIPWDSEDVNQIIPAIPQALGYPSGDLSVVSPEGRYYTEISGEGRQARATVPFVFNESASTIETVDGLLLQPTQRVGKDHNGIGENDPLGYRLSGSYLLFSTSDGIVKELSRLI